MFLWQDWTRWLWDRSYRHYIKPAACSVHAVYRSSSSGSVHVGRRQAIHIIQVSTISLIMPKKQSVYAEKPRRAVTFDPGPPLVHEIPGRHQESRRGSWVGDRFFFEMRLKRAEPNISRILEAQFRDLCTRERASKEGGGKEWLIWFFVGMGVVTCHAELNYAHISFTLIDINEQQH